jgi:general secretion pathway protein G
VGAGKQPGHGGAVPWWRMGQQRRHRGNVRGLRGFTLIELLIVIAILLAIGGLVVVNLIPRGEQAKTDIQRVQIDNIANALQHFRLDMDRWPTEEEGLEVLWKSDALEDEADQERWRGPYMDKVLEDRWGNELVYRYPGQIRGESYYDLVSFGPDGEEDTDDDITNHDRLRTEDGEMPEDIDFGAPDAGAGDAGGGG